MEKNNRNKGIVITQTPFRISFFGGGTDFPQFFNEHGGAVIGVSINKYIYVTINLLERLLQQKIRLSYSKLENVDLTSELQHDIAREILDYHTFFKDGDFIDIHTFADLPASSGVGSSSSFTVGMLNNIYALNSVYKSRKELAKEAIYLEREKLEDAGGWQDQIFAAYGGLNHIEFFNNSFSVSKITLTDDKLQALEDSCLLFFTGYLRSSGKIQNKLIDSFNSQKKNHLYKIKSKVDEVLSILKRSTSSVEMVRDFGLLLNETWEEKKKLLRQISNEQIDLIYQLGINAGAYGGKLCGAGAGGFMVFIVPVQKKLSVINALHNYKLIDVKFENLGTQVIFKRK